MQLEGGLDGIISQAGMHVQDFNMAFTLTNTVTSTSYPAFGNTVTQLFAVPQLTTQTVTATSLNTAGYTITIGNDINVMTAPSIWAEWCQDDPKGRLKSGWRSPAVLRGEPSDSTLWTAWVNAQEISAAEHRRRTAYRTQEEARRGEELRLKEIADQAERDAMRRSKKLFLEMLTPEQLAEFRERRIVRVVKRHMLQTRRYALRPGQSPVEVDDRDLVLGSFCIHPVESLPDYDKMIGHLLMLQHDEEHFLRTANRTDYAQRPTPLTGGVPIRLEPDTDELLAEAA